MIGAISVSIVAVAQTNQSPAAPDVTQPDKSSPSTPRKVDKAGAYYHYTLAHMYEEVKGRPPFIVESILNRPQPDAQREGSDTAA